MQVLVFAAYLTLADSLVDVKNKTKACNWHVPDVEASSNVLIEIKCFVLRAFEPTKTSLAWKALHVSPASSKAKERIMFHAASGPAQARLRRT